MSITNDSLNTKQQFSFVVYDANILIEFYIRSNVVKMYFL